MPAERERTGRLVAIDLDDTSIAHTHAFIEAERAVAIDDILADNSFRPSGRGAGPFRLRLSVRDNRLVFAIADEAGTPLVTHILALAPFARVVKASRSTISTSRATWTAVRGLSPVIIMHCRNSASG